MLINPWMDYSSIDISSPPLPHLSRIRKKNINFQVGGILHITAKLQGIFAKRHVD